jgi:hypothetical protein
MVQQRAAANRGTVERFSQHLEQQRLYRRGTANAKRAARKTVRRQPRSCEARPQAGVAT